MIERYTQRVFGDIPERTMIRHILEKMEGTPYLSYDSAAYRNRRVYIRTDDRHELEDVFLDLWGFLNVSMRLYTEPKEVHGGLEVRSDNRLYFEIRPYSKGYVVISETERIWDYPDTVVLRAYARHLNRRSGSGQ